MSKKSVLDSVQVPVPCDEAWEGMIGGDVKRFCHGCEKDVYNLSAMTRKEAARFAVKNANKVCVRYSRLPDGRILTTDRVLHQISPRRSMVAAGVIAATVTLSGISHAQNKSPLPSKTVESRHSLTSETSEISFMVLDENRAAVSNAEVTLINKETKKESKVFTNKDGNAKFSKLTHGNYYLIVKFLGFRTENRSLLLEKPVESNITITLYAGYIGSFVVVTKPSKVGKSQKNAKTSSISFTISDPMGAAISEPLVTLTEEKTQQEFKSVGDKDGIAKFEHLPRGRYEMSASAQYFKTYRGYFQINEPFEPNVKIKLALGSVTGVISIERWTEIPLFDAIAEKDNEPVIRLLRSGFDINTRASDNITALHVAIANENWEIARFLLDHGVKVNIQSRDKKTPLLILSDATIVDADDIELEIFKLLIAKGANVNSQDDEKQTPLMIACENDTIEIVKILLNAHANPNLKDEDGETAYDKADSPEIKQLLIKYGAHPGKKSKDT